MCVAKFRKRLTKLRDRLGKEAQLQAFESFWLILDADGALRLHGCESIVTCTDTEISVACRDGVVTLKGMSLFGRGFGQSEIEVNGKIESIVFTK